MPKINLLDKDTINKIAAGEVIERPASIVKELVENSIDAGAGSIDVEIRDGGIGYIRITDDGSGIERDDLPLAFTSHATSKLSKAADLIGVMTMGFRGEALASIAAIAKVEAITKTWDAGEATRFVVEGGEKVSEESAGASDGTTMIIRDVFYNTPARLKFLKTASTEKAHVRDCVEKLALSHPDIAFRLTMDGRMEFTTSGNGSLKEIIYSIYGRQAVESLIPIAHESDGYRLSGYITKPQAARGNRSGEIFFVNGRHIKSGVLTKALENAYDGYLMSRKYPFAVLGLSFEPQLADVNVHPAKRELRFAADDAVYLAVYSPVRKALRETELIPMAHLGAASCNLDTGIKKTMNAGDTREVNYAMAHDSFPASGHAETGRTDGFVRETCESEPTKIQILQSDIEKNLYNKAWETVPDFAAFLNMAGQATPDGKIFTTENSPNFRLIGQLFGTYWLVQAGSDFLIVDQHAAHEKILYERTLDAWNNNGQIYSQTVNPPLMISLTLAQEETLLSLSDYFKQMGFDISSLGGREYAIMAVPYNMLSIAAEDMIREVLDSLNDAESVTEGALLRERMASMCCKAAIKGNTRISEAEAQAMIQDLLSLENPYTCPHGRPVIVRMTRYDMDRKFKRVQD